MARTNENAQKSEVKLFILAGPDAPNLDLLLDAPPGLTVVGMGRPDQEYADWTDQQWGQVEVLFKEGTGRASPSKQELQELWPKLTGLKWFHSNLAGVDKIMIPELQDRSIVVTNTKGVYSQPLAEWALAACCWFAKDLPRLQAQKARRDWQPYYVEELKGRTLGLIGFGGIGQEVVKIATAFKMKVIALRRRAELSQQDVELHLQVYAPDKLKTVMAASDYIVASLPLTPATHQLIDADAISSMKPNGVFINVGRGQNVDEEALIAALQAGRIKGAALDVTYTEPLPQNSPLWDLDNVLLSPHSAVKGDTIFSGPKQQFNELAALYMQGKELFNVVDTVEGY